MRTVLAKRAALFTRFEIARLKACRRTRTTSGSFLTTDLNSFALEVRLAAMGLGTDLA